MKYKPLLVSAALTLALVGCGQPDSLAYSRQQLELQQHRAAAERAEQQAVSMAPFDQALGAAWRVALAALPLVALGIGVDVYRQRRRPLVHVDHTGQLPVPRAMIDSGELAGAMVHALQAYHHTQQVAASQPRVDKLNVTIKEAPALGPVPQLVPATNAAVIEATHMPTLPLAPTFAQLVAEGFHARTERMLLGYGVDGPIYGGIEALLSTAIAGRPGQGKSTTLRMVYAQCLQVGAEVMLLDPHGSIAGDVQHGPSQLVASTGAELDDAAAWLTSELERRLTAYRQGGRVFRPLLVMADEMPVIALSSKPAVQALGRVVLEARKLGGYALISGQGLPAANFGGRLVRDALSSRIIHKTTAAEGLRAGLDKNAAQLLEHLQPGYAVLDGPVQPQIVAIPMTTANDLTALSPVWCGSSSEPAPEHRYTALQSPAMLENSESVAFHQEGQNDAENGVQSASSVALPEVEHAQIVVLAKAGVSRRKICEIIYGATGGQDYSKVKSTLDAAGL